MITFKKGCLIQALKDWDVDLIVHCCNAQGVMRSGIAKQIKDNFPDTFLDYKKFCDEFDSKNLLGRFYITEDGVVNLIGQEYYGYDGKQYAGYDYIRRGLRDLNYSLFEDNFEIGFPYKFASDRGGCDWDKILEIIKEELPNQHVIIYQLP